jgi:hypothetical protein
MTLNNATFSLNAFEKRAKSVQTLFESNLKSVQKVAAAFRKLARTNTYGYFGDRLGVGCMGIVEGCVLDDYVCDIFLRNFWYIKFQPFQKDGSVLRTKSRTLCVSSTFQRWIDWGLTHYNSSSMMGVGFGCLSERAENTLSVAYWGIHNNWVKFVPAFLLSCWSDYCAFSHAICKRSRMARVGLRTECCSMRGTTSLPTPVGCWIYWLPIPIGTYKASASIACCNLKQI